MKHWPNNPFPRPTRRELENFENQTKIQLNAVRELQRLTTNFPQANATTTLFPRWISEVDNWEKSAADLLERIRSVRDFLRYESEIMDAGK